MLFASLLRYEIYQNEMNVLSSGPAEESVLKSPVLKSREGENS